MLRIPGEGEACAELVAPIHRIGFSTEPDPKKKGHGSKKKRGAGSSRTDAKQGNGFFEVLKTLVVWGLCFALIIGGVFLFLKHTEPEPEKFEMQVDPDAGDAVLEVPASLLGGEE